MCPLEFGWAQRPRLEEIREGVGDLELSVVGESLGSPGSSVVRAATARLPAWRA